MRSLWTRGLLLLVSALGAVGVASAQNGVYNAPTPQYQNIPSPPGAGSWPTSYDYYNRPSTRPAVTATSFNSSFLTTQEAAAPTPLPQPTISSEYAQGLQSSCWDCGAPCGSCCGGNWFASVGGLVMGRNRANGYWTTYETNNNVNQLMNTQGAGANWGGGGQITAGFNFCPCGPSLAVTYWGVAGMTGFASIRDVNDGLSTPINLQTQSGDVMIGAQPASHFFDNSREHRISRDDQINNVEINLLQGNMVNGGRLQMVGIAGFRFFRFDETVSFGATAAGVEFGTPGGADEAYMDFRAVNNLYGFQVGSIFNYMATPRLGLFITPKAGIYGNQMITRSHLYAADGTEGFDIKGYKNDISFLAEMDFGMNYAFTPNFRGFLGYRVVAVTGVALADNQFLPYLADSAGFAQVKENGDLILHGAFIGGSWSF